MPSNRRKESRKNRPAGKRSRGARPAGHRPHEAEAHRPEPHEAHPAHGLKPHKAEPHGSKTHRAPPAEHSYRSLIPVNEAPIRRAAIRKCRYILERFDAVMADLNRYDTEDRPAFRAWYHRTFGTTLSELNELAEQIDYREGLIYDIQSLRFRERLSPYEAYCKAIDMREHPERYSSSWSSDSSESGEDFEDDYDFEADKRGAHDEYHADEEEPFEQSWEQEMPEEERVHYIVSLMKSHRTFAGLDEDSAEFQTIFEQVWRLMFDEPPPSAERRRSYCSGGGRESGGGRRQGTTEDKAARAGENTPDDKTARLKQVYRALVKQLHPDLRGTHGANGNRVNASVETGGTNGNAGSAWDEAALDELWLRAQQAYREGDLDGLEVARAGLEMRNARDLTGLPVADILAVHREYKEELRALRRRHRALAKYDPAWEFTTRPKRDLKRLHAEIEEELAAELADRLAHRSRLDLILEQFARPPAEHGGRSAKKRRQGGFRESEDQLTLF